MLNNQLAELHLDEIRFIYNAINFSPDCIQFNYNNLASNKFNFVPKYNFYVYKNLESNGSVEFKLFLVNTEKKLIDKLYFEYKDYLILKENSLFYIPVPKHLESIANNNIISNNVNLQSNFQISNTLPVNLLEYNLNNNNINNIFNININLDIYNIKDNNTPNYITEKNRDLSKWSPSSSENNFSNNSPKTLGKSISSFLRNIIFPKK
uniref:Uncharacterized protein n=1 Tax=Inonotus obliquus TaxID=167356 RepID=A0A5A4U7K3_9AGAM|nr:hypothetical protein [Inonotus obliquus]BBN21303.1 hypothetical protein [Inonotus obliquus]